MEIMDFVNQSSVTITFYVAVVTGLVEIVKASLVSNTRYAPILSLLISELLVVFTLGDEIGLSARIILGIIVGLTASGFYSGLKTLTK